MNKKLPPDAFDAYVALGQKRSYSALAEQFGVDRKTILRRAALENWQQRLVGIEQQARRAGDQKIAETIEQMNDRHLKTLRVIQGKAIQALSSMPLTDAMDAVRALDLSIRNERLIRGEPSERTDISMEQIIRGEYDRWMRASEPKTPAPENSQRGDKASTPLSVNGNVLAIGNETEEDSDDDA